MRLQFLPLFFAILTCTFAYRTTLEYDQARDAASRRQEGIHEGPTYMFAEYWTTSRFTIEFPACVTGYKHIRLIVGEVIITDKGGRREKRDFKALAWDLYVTDRTAGQALSGGRNGYLAERWTARAGNTFEYLGKTTRSDSTIEAYGKCKYSSRRLTRFVDTRVQPQPLYEIILIMATPPMPIAGASWRGCLIKLDTGLYNMP